MNPVEITEEQNKAWMGDMIGEALLSDDKHCMVIFPPQMDETRYVDARLILLFLMFLADEIDYEEYHIMTGQAMMDIMLGL